MPAPGKVLAWFLVLLAALWLLEIGADIHILRKLPRANPAGTYDLIAVFGGDDARVRRGIQLGQQGLARAFVVSDSDTGKLKAAFRAWGRPGQAEILMEPFAGTTDQNARYVAHLARRHGVRRLLLVTSWFHLPRSYLLLRAALAGSGIRVDLCPAEALPRHWLLKMDFWRESFKLWGSLARWGWAEVKDSNYKG